MVLEHHCVDLQDEFLRELGIDLTDSAEHHHGPVLRMLLGKGR
jgi:hypothetical protein